MKNTQTHGSTIPYLDESVDGWQAYCAGMGLSKNPNKRFTEEWRHWKESYLNAKDAKKRGMLEGETRELPASQYRERHNIDK